MRTDISSASTTGVPPLRKMLALGIPFHGNASKIPWTLINDHNPENNKHVLEMSCLLPIVKLGLNRTIYQSPNSPVFKVVEEISNHTDSHKGVQPGSASHLGCPFPGCNNHCRYQGGQRVFTEWNPSSNTRRCHHMAGSDSRWR